LVLISNRLCGYSIKNYKQRVHHLPNLQILFKYHNGKKIKIIGIESPMKNKKIILKNTIALHSLLTSKFDVKIDNKILTSFLNRLKEVIKSCNN
jgi:hypothetical protein